MDVRVMDNQSSLNHPHPIELTTNELKIVIGVELSKEAELPPRSNHEKLRG